MSVGKDEKHKRFKTMLDDADLTIASHGGLRIGAGMIYSQVQVPGGGRLVEVSGRQYIRWYGVETVERQTFNGSLRDFLMLRQSSPEQVMEFARKYGVLRRWHDVDGQQLTDDEFALFGMDDSDSLEWWLRYPRKARAMLTIASFLRRDEERDKGGTAQRIFQPTEDCWRDAFFNSGLPAKKAGRTPSEEQRVRQVFGAPRNEQYRTLHWLLETWIGGMEMSFQMEETNPQFPSVPVMSLRIRPTDVTERGYKSGLLHGLGLQLLSVLQHPNRIERCDVCGSPFLVAEGESKPRYDKAVLCYDPECRRIRHLELMKQRRDQKRVESPSL